MHISRISSFFASLLLGVYSQGASAQCWSPGKNLSAVELTACFMAEYQRCEETVPGFTGKASKSIGNLTNAAKYKEISKAKDFDRFRQSAYKNLVATNWRAGDSCKSKLEYLERGNF